RRNWRRKIAPPAQFVDRDAQLGAQARLADGELDNRRCLFRVGRNFISKRDRHAFEARGSQFEPSPPSGRPGGPVTPRQPPAPLRGRVLKWSVENSDKLSNWFSVRAIAANRARNEQRDDPLCANIELPSEFIVEVRDQHTGTFSGGFSC